MVGYFAPAAPPPPASMSAPAPASEINVSARVSPRQAMTVWTATYYCSRDGRGDDILDELDRLMGVVGASNQVDGYRGYFDVGAESAGLDEMLEAIDDECWEHVAKRRH